MNLTMVHDFDVGDILPDWKLILDEGYKYMERVVLICDFKYDEESGCALVFENEQLAELLTF